ncbi:MAG: 4'-phosphopantetheinyl transferase superfamily protein [Anaerolineae bacterium]|nr:4'-phosphopantetheinyl transferase superfamily protein [Anaerolineae bacterium]
MMRLELKPDEVHVWQIDFDTWKSQCQCLRALLSSDEIARAARYRVDLPRERFIVARGVLRLLLSRYLDLSPERIPLTYTPHGKPVLVTSTVPNATYISQPSTLNPQPGTHNSQSPTRNLHFNLSHSGSLILYTFALERRVGVDVELVRPVDAMERRIAQFFSAREQAAFRALPDEVRQRVFFRAWTCKEAYIKAWGTGFALSFDQFDVSLDPTSPSRLLADRRNPQMVELWRLQDIDVGQDYMAALAVECRNGAPFRLSFFTCP